MPEQSKILIVDDSQELTEVIHEYMEACGFIVDTTTESTDALRLIAANGYDVIVSDIHMPGMDGLELMGLIKDRHPDLPVVLITGYSISEARKIALEKGADAFVAKPFHMKEILDVVTGVLNKKRFITT
ncbi:MAG TPA: response regulator [Desulfomonilia bacterium]|jgi:two-component system response regulator FlrC